MLDRWCGIQISASGGRIEKNSPTVYVFALMQNKHKHVYSFLFLCPDPFASLWLCIQFLNTSVSSAFLSNHTEAVGMRAGWDEHNITHGSGGKSNLTEDSTQHILLQWITIMGWNASITVNSFTGCPAAMVTFLPSLLTCLVSPSKTSQPSAHIIFILWAGVFYNGLWSY